MGLEVGEVGVFDQDLQLNQPVRLEHPGGPQTAKVLGGHEAGGPALRRLHDGLAAPAVRRAP